MSLVKILDIPKIVAGLSPNAKVFSPGLYQCFRIINHLRYLSQDPPDILQALHPITGSAVRKVQH